MTTAELNRDVKKFVNQIKKGKIDPESKEAKSEFSRLYGADKTLKSHSAVSIRLLLRLNVKYQYEPWHLFGIFIDL